MNLDRLRQLATELFVDNYRYEGGRYFNPLNVEAVEDQPERRQWRAVMPSIGEVASAIERDGGITQQTYQAHKTAIHAIARDVAGLRHWGSGLAELCWREDQEGKLATPAQIARFPKDGKCGGRVEEAHVNIFGKEGRSGFEGTLFQIGYDEGGYLETLRLFHQGHRDSLSVKRVDIPSLLQAIRDKAEADDSFTFPLERDAYLERIAAFNNEFGAYVRLRVFERKDGPSVYAEFKENPQVLADKLVTYAQAGGVRLRSHRGSVTVSISGDQGLADLFLERHITTVRPSTYQPIGGGLEKEDLGDWSFDPSRDAGESTLIMPYLDPDFSISLIRLYVASQKVR